MGKYKVGDKVRIVKKRAGSMIPSMDKYLGSVMCICRVLPSGGYEMLEDGGRWSWDDASIENYANIIKKSDLRNGDILTYRKGFEGSKKILQDNKMWYLSDFTNLSMHLSDYDEDLFCLVDCDFDIVKVYRPETEETFYTERTKKVKEMTIAELEKELGYPIKIVKEEK